MKLVVSSAILAQILSGSSTRTDAARAGKRLFGKQGRQARIRRLGQELFSSYTGQTTNLVAEQNRLNPLSIAQKHDHVNNNKDAVEADVGLLAYQSNDAVGDFSTVEGEHHGTDRRLQAYCDYFASYIGGECDCSQVDPTTYMGKLSCSYVGEENCYCQDMLAETKFCFSYNFNVVMEGNITYYGYKSQDFEVCASFFYKPVFAENPPPVCFKYSYDQYGYAETCTMALGDTYCNSCTMANYTGVNSTDTNRYCFDFDCENFDDQATGTQVGSTCVKEWPTSKLELFFSKEWDSDVDGCPVDDAVTDDDVVTDDGSTPDVTGGSTPDDSTTTDGSTPEESAPPLDAIKTDPPSPTATEPPAADGAVHTSTSLASFLGAALGAMMLTACVFEV